MLDDDVSGDHGCDVSGIPLMTPLTNDVSRDAGAGSGRHVLDVTEWIGNTSMFMRVIGNAAAKMHSLVTSERCTARVMTSRSSGHWRRPGFLYGDVRAGGEDGARYWRAGSGGDRPRHRRRTVSGRLALSDLLTCACCVKLLTHSLTHALSVSGRVPVDPPHDADDPELRTGAVQEDEGAAPREETLRYSALPDAAQVRRAPAQTVEEGPLVRVHLLKFAEKILNIAYRNSFCL